LRQPDPEKVENTAKENLGGEKFCGKMALKVNIPTKTGPGDQRRKAGRGGVRGINKRTASKMISTGRIPGDVQKKRPAH